MHIIWKNNLWLNKSDNMTTYKYIAVKCVNKSSTNEKAHYVINTKNGAIIDIIIGKNADIIFVAGKNNIVKKD